MDRFLRSITVFLLCVFAGIVGLASAAESVTVSVDQERVYYPGDLIEVELAARSSEYGRYSIREPSHPSVRYRETQSFPVRKVGDDSYEQRWIVLYQISRSGEIALAGGELWNKSDSEGEPVSLDPIVIQSEGFGSERDSNHPEALRPGGTTRSRSIWMYLVSGSVLFALVCLFWWKTRRDANRVARPEKSPLQVAIQRILVGCDSGKMPIDELERFLHHYQSACSPSLIEMIEQLVYSRNGQMAELKDRLRREFAP